MNRQEFLEIFNKAENKDMSPGTKPSNYLNKTSQNTYFFWNSWESEERPPKKPSADLGDEEFRPRDQES